MNDKTKSATAEAVDEAYHEQPAADFEAEDYELPADAVVIRGEGDEPGRAILAQYMTPEELDAAIVRLAQAQAQGRTPSAVIREAVETYVRSA